MSRNFLDFFHCRSISQFLQDHSSNPIHPILSSIQSYPSNTILSNPILSIQSILTNQHPILTNLSNPIQSHPIPSNPNPSNPILYNYIPSHSTSPYTMPYYVMQSHAMPSQARSCLTFLLLSLLNCFPFSI